MRFALVLLTVGVLAAVAFAAPAAADITVNHLPVHACLSTICTPCPDPIVVTEGVVDFKLTGAPC